jgi:hypothetical protein
VAGQALDMVRSQAVLMDEIAASWVDGLLRRRAKPGPPGLPPAGPANEPGTPVAP